MISTAAGILFSLLLVVGVPVISYLTARQPQIRLIPRRALYLSAMFSQWVLSVLGALVVLASSGFAAAGFRTVGFIAFLRWTALLTLGALAAVGLVLALEHWGWWPEESELVRLILPATRGEKVWAVLLVAPTAAVCEEFLYRGYLLAQLQQWLDSGPWALVLSSIAFGLGHAYQGAAGAARAAFLGAWLGYPVLLTGSLYPSMAAHFLIDALALGWLGPRFVERRPFEQSGSAS